MLLRKELNEISAIASEPDNLNPSVSQKGIYWHTDHILKSIIGICKTLQKSDPETFRWKFNYRRFVLFNLGFFPRGKAKAPKTVTSEGEIFREDLIKQLQLAEKLLPVLENLPCESHFSHPYFGELNIKLSKRMLLIHTRHHLKIIRDIGR